jgi:glycosyltransferase involved in cell wall biosynthesis
VGYRVLLTCEDYLPVMGGAEICVAQLRAQLIAKGHAATVYTNTLQATDDETGIVRVRWSFTPRGLWRNVAALWRLIGGHDVVHCQYSFRLAALCAPLCGLRGKPMVLTQQGKGIVPEAHTKLRHLFLYKLCQRVSMRCATILTSTSDEITDLTAAFVPRSKIIPVSNGYDATLFKPDPSLPKPPELDVPPGMRTLLTVRRLVPKNGIHILVQALALVKEQRTDFRYVAIGEGRARPVIEKLVEELGLQEHVMLLGSRPNDTLRAYYQHADLLLVPSSAEATSIACIEAMGMEKPLIASRVGGLIDLLGTDSRFGLLVPIYDSEACTYDPPDTLPRERLQPLANAIVSFLKDPKPFEERAARARERAEKEYAWSVIAERYISIYRMFLPSA